jgi:hypothetical protein
MCLHACSLTKAEALLERAEHEGVPQAVLDDARTLDIGLQGGDLGLQTRHEQRLLEPASLLDTCTK